MPKVTSIKGILAIYEDDVLTWTNPATRQTPVIVTYSFSSGAKLDKFGNGFPGSSYYKFTKAQRENFRDAADEISAVSGVIFVEVNGRAMINVARGENTDVGGFANYPVTGPDFSDSFFSQYVIDGPGQFHEGSYEYLTLLHELGHAVGLSHPHEGPFKLTNSVDNLDHTVMTYNNDTGTDTFPTKLGSLDVKALQYLYGSSINTKGWSFKQGADAFKISGSGRNDVIFGVADQNSISGGGGRDTLIGRDFDDLLIGGKKGDVIDGNFGDDTLRGEAGDDGIDGGQGADRIYGGQGRDDLKGRDGRDQIYGGDGVDNINGGSDEDILFGGAGNDKMNGSSGEDTLFGGSGDDTLQDGGFGSQAQDKIYGGDGRDEIRGGAGSDQLFGGAAKDQIYGGNGDDVISGSDGHDTIHGGNNNDSLFGGAHDDKMYGGNGQDTIDAGRGINAVWGGGGNDSFVFANLGSSSGKTTIKDFEVGDDIIDLTDFAITFDALTLEDASAGLRITLTDGARIVLSGFSVDTASDGFFDF